MVVAGEVCPWNPCSRGARRVAEVKEKRSLAAEKTLQQVRSHNKEKYLQPMHLPTSTFFFVLHMPLAVAQLFEREREKNPPKCDDTLSVQHTVFESYPKKVPSELGLNKIENDLF